MSDYTASEMMIAVAARHLVAARTVFVGVGIPNIACNLAIRTGNPDLALIYQSGVYGAQPARLPLSIGNPTLVARAAAVMPMSDLFMYYLQGSLVDVALLGAGPDRPLRQPQQHHRRDGLFPPQGAPARQRRGLRRSQSTPGAS